MPQNKKTHTRECFKRWLALPEEKREPDNQTKFADLYGCHPQQLSSWKKEKEFMDDVEEIRRDHLDEALSDIYKVIVEKAKEGDKDMVKLALQQSGRERVIEDEDDNAGAAKQVMTSTDEQLTEYVAEALAGSDEFKDKGLNQDKVQEILMTQLYGE